jgi:two-component system nitrate/nitrite response regulator NarL
MNLGPAASVLIADADEGARAELASVFAAAGYVVHQAATGDEAIAAARDHRPAVAILEVPLPGLSGYEVCRSLKAEHGSSLPVLFLSGERTQPYDRVAGLLIGGDDYVTKPYAADEVLARVRRLEVGSRPFSGPLRGALTRRESEVLHMLAQGLTQLEIAERLEIRPKTVGTHIEHLMQKLGVHSRVQAVALALSEVTPQIALPLQPDAASETRTQTTTV